MRTESLYGLREGNEYLLDCDLALAGLDDLNQAASAIPTLTGAMDRFRGGATGVTTVGLGIAPDCIEKGLAYSYAKGFREGVELNNASLLLPCP